jgi:hypothetical protein
MTRPPAGTDDDTRAWACLMTNLLVLPGLGSLLVGRRIGWLQAGVALLGFAFTLVWLVWFVVTWSETGSFPLDGGPYLGEGIGGVLIFGASWMWGLATGLVVVRESGRRPGV